MPLKQRLNGNETQTKTNGRQGVVWRFDGVVLFGMYLPVV